MVFLSLSLIHATYKKASFGLEEAKEIIWRKSWLERMGGTKKK